MTTTEKHLLGIDLCARAFSNVLCWVEGAEKPKRLVGFHVEDANNIIYKFEHNGLHNLEVYSSEVKPYLRPMSSMTKEEWQEYDDFCDSYRGEELCKLTDWMNSKHIDYRTTPDGKTMIEAGLALKAPEGMYKTE